MSTIKSSNEHLTFNADGSAKEIRFQANGTQKASISSAGAFTSTTIDATVLTGNLPAISAANLTSIPAGNLTGTVADARISALTASKLTGALPAISGANLTGLSSFDPDGAVVFNESGADVDFRVESDNKTHALFVEGSSGHVGIGKTDPNHPLHIEADENYALYVKQTGSNVHVAALRGEGSSGLDFQLRGGSNTVSLNSTGTGDAILFETEDGNEKMRITSSGKVGIGNTGTQSEFSVTTGGATGGGQTMGIQVRQNGYSGYKSGMTAGDTSDTTYNCGFIGFLGGGHTGNGMRHIVFETRPGTTDAAPTERMRITDDGRGLSLFTAKAWVRYRTNLTNPLIRASHNVSSLTDNGVGNTNINFTNNLADSNYAISVSGITQYSHNGMNYNVTGQTTSTYQIIYHENTVARDGEFRSIVFGN